MLLLLLVFALAFSADGKIREITCQVAGLVGMAPVVQFGLAQRGTVSFDYSIMLNNEDVTLEQMNNYNLYFVAAVINEEMRSAYFDKLLEGQVFNLGDIEAETMCNSPTVARWQLHGTGNFTHTIVGRDARAERYTALLLQCRTGLAASSSDYPTLDVSFGVTMTNARPGGNGVSHLGVEDAMMVRSLEGECIVYMMMLGGLLCQMWYHKGHNLNLQYMFLGCCLISVITAFIRYGRWYEMNFTGGYNVHLVLASRIFESIQEVAFLTTILMLALGWSTIHFQLSDTQVKATLSGMALFLIMSLAWASCLSEDSRVCQSLYLVYYILHALIMLGIIICLNFTITQLRAMLSHSAWDPSTPYCYARTKQFQTFRIAFVLYLLLPTAIALVQEIMYTWEQDWLGTVLPDLLQICLFLNVGSTFAPLKDVFMNRAFSQQFVVPVDETPWGG